MLAVDGDDAPVAGVLVPDVAASAAFALPFAGWVYFPFAHRVCLGTGVTKTPRHGSLRRIPVVLRTSRIADGRVRRTGPATS